MNIKFNIKKLEQNVSPYRICVVDNIGGCYLPVATRLSKFFSKTYYYSVNQSPFPRMPLSYIGTGYNNINVLQDFWGNLDMFDIIIFPDIYFSGWGKALRTMGKMVWGGSDAEIIETNRELFINELKGVGLPVPTIKFIKGITNLKKELKNKQDKWIKISYFRGEAETFHHVNIQQSEMQLQELSYTLGPLSDEIEFMVQDSIDAVEIGYDGWTIGGEYPPSGIFGIEVKNSCYVGKSVDYKDLLEPVQFVNDKFAPVLKKYNANGFYSTEIRYTDKKVPYYTDICMRAGSPPSNTELEMIENWDEIIVGGCQGKVVEPLWNSDYGVEIILKSSYVNQNYYPLIFPPEYENNIKLKGSFIHNEKHYVIPFKFTNFILEEIGSVVVIGDNYGECIKQALEICSKIDSYDLHYDSEAFKNAQEGITKFESLLNIKF